MHMLCNINNNSAELECSFKRTVPSSSVFVLYAILIPIFAMFGCVANALNALVFMRPKMTPSAFTYLTILSWVDSLCCIIILCTCVSRIYLNSLACTYFDLRLQNPLFGTLSGAANWILAAVTMDRIIYLRHRLPQTQPKFCTRPVARRNVCGIILISALLNGPYYFMFRLQNDGTFYATNFYKSKIYKIHNWFAFTVLCIIPGIFLLIGNISVIIIFRRWVKKCKSLYNPGRKDNPAKRNRQEYQLKLTITIIIVVFLYLFGELPSHITSRKNAVNLVFGGDVSKINFENVEKFESIFLTLNVVQLSFNIIVYAAVNPSFMTEFKNLIYLILGFTAIRKCWSKLRNRVPIDGDFENPASNSNYNEIFVIEEEYHNSVRLDMEMMKKDKMYVHRNRKTKSCFDLRLLGPRRSAPEEWFGCGRILQRHSLSF